MFYSALYIDEQMSIEQRWFQMRVRDGTRGTSLSHNSNVSMVVILLAYCWVKRLQNNWYSENK